MNTDDFIHALCIWREARGEGIQGMQAVSNVIRNRARRSGLTIYQEVTKRFQFSAITAPGDPMLNVYPDRDDKQWLAAQDIVDNEHIEDITQGATHYFNPQVVLPAWSASLTKVCSLGNHDFYKKV